MRSIMTAQTCLQTVSETTSHGWISDALKTVNYKIGNGKKRLWADIISVGIDTSGSTNNITSGQRGDYTTAYVSTSGTDPIIVAEIKGVIKYLAKMSEIYDLSRVILQVFAFSSSLDKAFECVLENNESLDIVFRKLMFAMKYEFGATNLMSFINQVCTDELLKTKSAHVIIATDGQPNVGGYVNDILDYLYKLPYEVYDKLTMAIIGAGSIQEAPNGGRGIFSLSDDRNTAEFNVRSEPLKVSLQSLLSAISGSSECNITFLLQIMNKMKRSVYLPAYGAYEELEATATEYLSTDVYIKRYYVLLDGGRNAELASGIQEKLRSGQNVLAKVNTAWYIYTKKWQMAVDPQKSLNDETMYVLQDDALFNCSYEEVMTRKTSSLIGFEDSFLKVLQDSNGYWRCRKILRR